jgi:prepilin-type N-terminal cleavage/methylation domain-containing protein
MNRAVTLMELLVALIVTSILVLYFFAIEKIGRQDLITADRRAKVQNDVSYVLDHMTTNITGRMKLAADNETYQIRGGAIGNTQLSSQYPIDTSQINGDNAIKVRIDSNNNGQRDSNDIQIAYRYSPASNYQIWHYPNYTAYTGSLVTCTCPTPGDLTTCCEVLTGSRIRPDFSSTTGQDKTYVVYDPNNNYLDVQVTGCWDPAEATHTCGHADNPSVTMRSYIRMPSVTTN